MSELYNANNIPHGFPGGAVTFLSNPGSSSAAGAAITDPIRVVEGFEPERPTGKIERPDQDNNFGGQAITGYKKQTAKTRVQVPQTTSPMLTAGMYFAVTLNGRAERWVVEEASDKYPFEGYWFQDVSFFYDPYA
jgi:hypothetical protein